MSAYQITIPTACRCCKRALSFVESHEFEEDDGTAACQDCWVSWTSEMRDYMRGNGPLPEQP